MRLGIFAKTFSRSSLDDVLDAICGHGIREVHFNFACAGLEPLPAEITPALCQSIRKAFDSRGLTMCSVSGTYNAIHPDVALRADLSRRACRMIQQCPALDTSMVTLCTGTRCRDDMWTEHPDNDSPDAWDDLRRTLETLLDAARRAGVILCVEPEHANVIFTAARARRLLDEFASPHLKVVIDAANLLKPEAVPQADAVLENAFQLLAPDIVMAHAKDLPRDPGGSKAAGSGLVDWSYYLAGLNRIGFTGPLVLHGLEEREVTESVRFLTSIVSTKSQSTANSQSTAASQKTGAPR